MNPRLCLLVWFFFHQKENIEKFLTFCETYGVRDRFSTPYLYQKQNIMAVSFREGFWT